jgi:hypothetical protein
MLDPQRALYDIISGFFIHVSHHLWFGLGATGAIVEFSQCGDLPLTRNARETLA